MIERERLDQRPSRGASASPHHTVSKWRRASEPASQGAGLTARSSLGLLTRKGGGGDQLALAGDARAVRGVDGPWAGSVALDSRLTGGRWAEAFLAATGPRGARRSPLELLVDGMGGAPFVSNSFSNITLNRGGTNSPTRPAVVARRTARPRATRAVGTSGPVRPGAKRCIARIPARPVSDVAAWRAPAYRSEAVRVGGLGSRLRGQSVSPPRYGETGRAAGVECLGPYGVVLHAHHLNFSAIPFSLG